MNIKRLISSYVGDLSYDFSPVNFLDNGSKLLLHYQNTSRKMAQVREEIAI